MVRNPLGHEVLGLPGLRLTSQCPFNSAQHAPGPACWRATALRQASGWTVVSVGLRPDGVAAGQAEDSVEGWGVCRYGDDRAEQALAFPPVRIALLGRDDR